MSTRTWIGSSLALTAIVTLVVAVTSTPTPDSQPRPEGRGESGSALAVAARNSEDRGARRPTTDGGSSDTGTGGAGSAAGANLRPAEDPEFSTLVERFVVLASEAAHRHGTGQSIDDRSRRIEDLVRTIENRFPDAAERSAAAWVAEPGDEKSEYANRLFERLLRRALTDRLRRPGDHGPRDGEAALDLLVRRLLARMPESEAAAAFFGRELLVDRPFLREGSEADLLELTELVPDRPFLIPVLADLLRTLWVNLRASGARSPVQLDALARLFADDWNPARKLAAASELFANGDDGLRSLLIEKARRSGDPDLAAVVARSAVDHLDPAEAFETVAALHPALAGPPVALLDALATRDVSVIVDGYESRLATGRAAAFRSALVSAMFANRGSASVEVARTALQLEPEPQVRESALLLCAARMPTDEAFDWLRAALTDARLGPPSRRIEIVATALHNLAPRAPAGQTLEFIDRLWSDPACSPNARHRLASARDRVADGSR